MHFIITFVIRIKLNTKAEINLPFMKKISVFLAAASMMCFSANAQDSYASKYRVWSVGLEVGGSYFSGDLMGFYPESNVDGHNLGFSVSVPVTYWMNHFVGLEGQLGLNTLTGKNVNTYFKSTEMNGGLNMLLNVSSLINKGAFDSRWSWIPFVGIGGSTSTPENFDASDNAILTRDDSYSEVILQGGILVKYQINNTWDLNLRAQASTTAISEWMDNIESGINNDSYMTLRVGVAYNFGSQEKSIVYARPLNDMAKDVAEMGEKVDAMTSDSDGDGVADYMDKEANTPEGYVVDGSGRAIDSDRDGIADDIDQDPFSPRGAKVDASGREVDSDGDGVPDSRDMENNTPAGVMVNFQGKTIQASGSGGDAFFPEAYFETNSATVTSANATRLSTIAKIMKKDANIKMRVIGHADQTGSEKYNMTLSERRAKAIVKVLVNDYGIDESRFEVVGKGEGDPISKKNNANRRVEFEVIK